MARRGYLQRIAEPLTPGEPVLFAVPGPAAEDARPAVTARRPAGAAPAAAAPANPAPILRRQQAARGEKAVADQKPVPVADPGPPQADPNAAPRGAKQIPALNANMPQDWAAPAPAFAPPAATTEPGEKTPPASTPQPALSPIPPGEAASEPASVPTQYAATWPAEHLPAPRTPRYPQSHPEEEPAPDAPRWPAPRAAAKNTEPPRIHIGTIEIRTTTPPAPAAPPPGAAPAAAPRATAPSPPRGYAWRFGLVQG